MRDKQLFSPTTDVEPAQVGPVRIRFTERGDKGGMIELWLDYEKAETPARAYFADYVSVVKGRADVTLIFGRLVPGKHLLRSQVEISFPQYNFVSNLWRSTREMHQALKKDPMAAGLEPLPDVTLSDVVHTSRANSIFVALMGEEAVCDFYYIAPSDLQFARMGRRHTVPLEPIVRISLPVPLVLDFLDQCESMVKQIPKAESILKAGQEEDV